MKVIGKILKSLILILTAAVVITVGSFATVFFVSKDEPKEIFIFDYALVAEKGEDEKIDVWFIRKTSSEYIEHGDGMVYYDGAYKSANAMLGRDGRIMYFDSDELDMSVTVGDDEIVGEILALWQQK